MGPAGSIEATKGLVDNQQEYKGLGGSIGFGYGAGVSAGPSYTWIKQFVDFDASPSSSLLAMPPPTVIPVSGAASPVLQENHNLLMAPLPVPDTVEGLNPIMQQNGSAPQLGK
jgi:hypothetical protein